VGAPGPASRPTRGSSGSSAWSCPSPPRTAASEDLIFTEALFPRLAGAAGNPVQVGPDHRVAQAGPLATGGSLASTERHIQSLERLAMRRLGFAMLLL
jgi:hypothetical protein